MTRRTLPLIVAARRCEHPLRDLVQAFYEALQAENDPRNAQTLLTMGHWLASRPGTP